MGSPQKSEDMSFPLTIPKVKTRQRQPLSAMHLAKIRGRMCQAGVFVKGEVVYDVYPWQGQPGLTCKTPRRESPLTKT
jgi:hypothetical protein